MRRKVSMKSMVLGILFGFLALCTEDPLYAKDVMLQWDRNEDTTNEYVIYRAVVTGDVSGYMGSIAVVPQTDSGVSPQYVDVNVPEGPLLYCVTAKDIEGRQSGPSNFAFTPAPYQECPECPPVPECPDCSQVPAAVLNLKILSGHSVTVKVD